MQKGFAPIFILVGILVLVGVAGGTYYLGRQTLSLRGASETSDAAILPTFTPVPSVSESTSSADMTDWKTYTNNKYGYSIKYPPKLTSIEFSPDKGYMVVSIVKKPENSTDEGTYSALLSISAFMPGSLLYDSDEIAKELLNLKEGDQYKPQDRIVGSLTRVYPTYKKLPDVTIGGLSANVFENPKTLHGGIEKRFYINKMNDIYLITSEFLPSEAQYFPQELYDQILSTFRFD